MSEIEELKLEYTRQKRLLENLKRNYERRKNLDLVDSVYERQIVYEIKQHENEVSSLARQIRSIQSQEARSKLINEK
jgi:putative IMPACT (imprinted ancient) family translation regulator